MSGGGGKGGQSAKVYRYHASMLLALCWGKVDRLYSVKFGDKLLVGTMIGGQTVMNVREPEFFGGDKKEGGAKGGLVFMDGSPTQRLHSKMAQKIYPDLDPSVVPGYRGIACLGVSDYMDAETGYTVAGAAQLHFTGETTMEEAVAGNIRGNWAQRSSPDSGFQLATNNPYLKAFAVEVSRPSADWYPEKAYLFRDAAHHAAFAGGTAPGSIEGKYDSNGIHCLYETFTNTDWGMGAPSWSMDEVAWRRAADICFEERLGISFRWREQMTFEAFAQMLVDHLRIAVFPHPKTGLTTVVCLRADYDVDDLITLDRTNSKLITTSVRENADVVNEIVVKWTNPDTNDEETVYAHDPASIARMGETVSETHSYKLFRRYDLAEEAASRDVFLKTAPIRSATLEPSTRWDNFVPGDVVNCNFPDDGIYNIAMRVMNVTLDSESDVQRLECAEDIFAELGSNAGPGVRGVRPSEEPNTISIVRISSAPYFVVRNYAADIPAGSEYFMFNAAVAASSTYAIEVYREITDASGEVELRNVADITPSRRGTLNTGLSWETSTDTTIPTDLTAGPPIERNSFLVIGSPGDDEVCLITSVVGGAIQLRRGCLDTVPKQWPPGTQCWIMNQNGSYVIAPDFAEGVSIDFELHPISINNSPPVITEITGTLISRADRPLRPATVRVNGFIRQDEVIAANPSGDFPITWANRNRLTEDAVVLAWTEGGVTPEADYVVHARLLDSVGGVIDSDTSIGTSLTLQSGAYTGAGTIEVWAERLGVQSYQRSVFSVTM